MRAPLFAAAAVALLAHCWLLWSAPAITIIGNVTIDTFSDGSSALGGAVSYAAAVVSGFGQRACIVSAHGPDAQLGDVFKGHDLVEVPSNRTLVFEHSYTLWGNHRRLRVAAQPDVTLSWADVPARCRRARVLLLGPLMPQDMHPASFLPSSRPWWERALGLLWPRQQVGLMAQGLQRRLEAGGRVAALPAPSHQLEAALGPSTLLFLSDVEADGWGNGTVASLAARTSRFLVTRGSAGADEWAGQDVQRHAVFDVPVVDTNGAGDTFATAYMLAAAAGHSDPVKVAHWAGAMAVSQPQDCKPACVTEALREGWGLQPASAASWLAVQQRLMGPAKLLAQLVGWGRAVSGSHAA